MNESTKTKKALRGSLFALFLCIVLLIGTTFAWFTDTASTGVNKIQAGNLDVGLERSLIHIFHYAHWYFRILSGRCFIRDPADEYPDSVHRQDL